MVRFVRSYVCQCLRLWISSIHCINISHSVYPSSHPKTFVLFPVVNIVIYVTSMNTHIRVFLDTFSLLWVMTRSAMTALKGGHLFNFTRNFYFPSWILLHCLGITIRKQGRESKQSPQVMLMLWNLEDPPNTRADWSGLLREATAWKLCHRDGGYFRVREINNRMGTPDSLHWKMHPNLG